jgi:hypothetical protein
MGKKIAVSIIVVIFLIIFAGIGIYFYKDTYYKNDAVKKSDYTLCSKISSDIKITQCIAEIALIKKDISICTNSQEAFVMTCFNIFAERSRDITACQKLSSEAEYNCYFAFADTLRDTSVCDALAGEKKDYCLKSIAIVKEDLSICDSLPASSIYKKSCPLDVEYHKA